jgi:thiamine-monophosphate kinase
MKPWQIGWYAVAINLSDLASKGARPVAFLSSVGMPPETPLSFVDEVYGGMKMCCDKYSCYIAGGDTNSNKNLVISGTAVGRIKRGDFIQRKGARKGDVVAVTGELGLAAVGLDVLLSHGESVDERAVDALLTPEPRVNEGVYLAENHLCSASMDISDGLASSLHQLARASGVGIEIHYDALPVPQSIRDYARSDEELERFVLYTGGDFQLLLTMSEESFKKAGKVIDIKRIGTVVGKGVCIRTDGSLRELKDSGYSHF